MDNSKSFDHEKDDDDKNKQVVLCNDIKSTTVIEKALFDQPIFTQLQKHTDLNKPLNNWSPGNDQLEHFLRGVCYGKNIQFPSFEIAQSFPGLMNEMDVISNADNIKRLLKITHSKNQVSMMVHRIDKTLLLEDFDVHKHLLRKEQDDWSWLKNFYHETIRQCSKHGGVIMKKNKSRDTYEAKDRLSKLLYYSYAESDAKYDNSQIDHSNMSPIHSTKEQISKVRSHFESNNFQRIVNWCFEDICMLIGTDLPIFGGGTHPCISLRLRDASQPINVLTGIDYWLDNLMCNVPELAMCYHHCGFVQNYEILKTEDIPNLEGSKFSSNVIKDVAQNILSFLKSNATKEGHTYWLFKGHGEDIVKLYDLSTLCADYMTDINDNPFTVPVGILMYRVARKMLQSSGKKYATTIEKLLTNCINLLSGSRHAQIMTSAHYLLTELYIRDNEESPSESDGSDLEDFPESEDESTYLAESYVDVKCLSTPYSVEPFSDNKLSKDNRKIKGDTEFKVNKAICHISKALVWLDHSLDDAIQSDKQKVETQKMCDPDEVITLGYETLNDSKMNESQIHNLVLSDASHNLSTTWHYRSKELLMKKATVAYYSLAKESMNQLEYGKTLQCLKIALICFYALKKLSKFKSNYCELISNIHGLAGSAYLLIARDEITVSKHIDGFYEMSSEHIAIIDSAESEQIQADGILIDELSSDSEILMLKCLQSYEIALESSKPPKESPTCSEYYDIMKSFANACNEIGVFYMNEAAKKIKNCADVNNFLSAIELTQKSLDIFLKGIVAFEGLNDELNQALLYSNQAQLHHLCAKIESQFSSRQGNGQFSEKQRAYYQKAIYSYLRSVKLLEKKFTLCDLWNNVRWDLSSTYFNMATQLQDCAPLAISSQEEIEKEIADLMMKALKYCDVDSQAPIQITFEYRAATIHYRLASLYHNAYRNQTLEQKKKHMKTLADLHYNKANHHFSKCGSFCELLRMQLEKFAMCEYQYVNHTNMSVKIKDLQDGVLILIDCIDPLKGILNMLSDDDKNTSYEPEIDKLTSLLDSRLSFCLINLIKCSSSNKKRGDSSDQCKLFKSVYSSILKQTLAVKEHSDISDKLTTLCENLLSKLDIIGTKCKNLSL